MNDSRVIDFYDTVVYDFDKLRLELVTETWAINAYDTRNFPSLGNRTSFTRLEDITIDNHLAQKYKYTEQDKFDNKTRFYDVVVFVNTDKEINKDRVMTITNISIEPISDLFDQILSTFRFTK